jgi:hypothetical protein
VKPLLHFTVCLFAAGCVSASVERLDHAARPARSPDSVAVLIEKPEQSYTVIAVIEAKGESVFDSFDDLRQKLLAEAAKLGGDAVILGQESTDSNFILTGTAMIESDTKKVSGEVIVFTRG